MIERTFFIIDDLLNGTSNKRAYGIYIDFAYDDEADGIYAFRQDGIYMTREEFDVLSEYMNRYFELHSDEEIKQHNIEMFNHWIDVQKNTNRPANRRTDSGWIYILRWENQNIYKIGKTTKTPELRLIDFVPKLPVSTELTLSYQCENVADEETALHSYFGSKRIRGEWFQLKQEDLEIISSRAS